MYIGVNERELRERVSKTMATASSSSKSKVPKRMAAATAKACSSLPDELWEYIIKFLNEDHCTFKSLSIVSKQLLSITNSLRLSVKITQQTIPFIPQLFQRFSNVTSLNIVSTEFLDALLTLISTFPLDIKSLILPYLFIIPTNGLRDLSKKMKNLTSLTCSKIYWINKEDIFFIADCFPLLEELVLKETRRSCYKRIAVRNFNSVLHEDNQFLALPKLRKISLYGISIDRQFINYLRNNRGPFTKEKNNLDGNDTA
jgi:hypothetical protein